MTRAHVLGLLLMTASLLFAGCRAAPDIARPTADMPFAPPHKGPGAPWVDSAVDRLLDRAWSEARNRQLESARLTAAKTSGAAASLLMLQLDLLEGSDVALERATELVGDHPQWASAWITTSIAAERLGDKAAALSAARQAATLWPRQRWQQRTSTLEERWIANPLDAAQAAIDQHQAGDAVATIQQVLEIEPAHTRAATLLASARLQLRQVDAARETIATLPQGPDRTLLEAKLLALEGDWLGAMQTLETLPPDNPERASLLRTARSRWRLANQPPYVQHALASEQLTRAELAVVLTATLPQITALATDAPPLLTDIMEERGREAILTVTALGILPADRLERLFHPSQKVTPDEVRRALTRLAVLLGTSWCPDEGDDDPCLTPPTTGPGVASALEQIADGVIR